MQIDLSEYRTEAMEALIQENLRTGNAVQWEEEKNVFSSKLKNTDVFREYAFESGALSDGLEMTLDNGVWVVALLNSGERTHCAYFLEHAAALRYLFLRVTKRSFHAVRSGD